MLLDPTGRAQVPVPLPHCESTDVRRLLQQLAVHTVNAALRPRGVALSAVGGGVTHDVEELGVAPKFDAPCRHLGVERFEVCRDVLW